MRPSEENAQRVYRALARFGAPVSGIKPDDFTELGIVFQIGVAPNRIDLLTSISGVEPFAEAWETAIGIVVGGVPLRVLSVPLLIQNKRATGRPRDLLDADWLENRERGEV